MSNDARQICFLKESVLQVARSSKPRFSALLPVVAQAGEFAVLHAGFFEPTGKQKGKQKALTSARTIWHPLRSRTLISFSETQCDCGKHDNEWLKNF